MKLYTIIGGVNGCGKSSLTGALKAERSDLGLIIDVDKLAAHLGSPVEGGKAAVRKIDECLEKGISFTQETTLSGARTERTIRRAKERGTPSACTTSAWIPWRKAWGASGTGWRKAATTFPKRTWSAASKAALRTCCGFSPIAMRPAFSTTTTALWRWRSTATGS